ncbi:MAG: phosphoserine phosphatase SerB [Piscirickettsiaceae bacterium]|nr:MAG: phosphoserine phosphatase SerB [Piscirickettsiaceae bacterium]PCI66480.1 MAG: phosphoserine phosphatase SerB [Piscirickettsiaceae bacterium]
MNKYIFHTAVLTDESMSMIELIFNQHAVPLNGYYCLNTEQVISDLELQTLREKLRCDVNVLNSDFKGSDIALLVTDMDSTLISIECIDEIADMLGIKKQVSAITESAMRGELDFAASLTQRIALLKGLPVEKLQQVYDERLTLNPGAETLIAFLKQHAIKLALVSGGFTFFTDKLKERLGLDYTLANTLEIENGCLTGQVAGDIIGAQAKADLLLALSTQLGLGKHQVIAMGDGANDLLMMDEAGLSVAYHAKPTVQAQTDIQINQGGLDTLVDLLNA